MNSSTTFAAVTPRGWTLIASTDGNDFRRDCLRTVPAHTSALAGAPLGSTRPVPSVYNSMIKPLGVAPAQAGRGVYAKQAAPPRGRYR